MREAAGQTVTLKPNIFGGDLSPQARFELARFYRHFLSRQARYRLTMCGYLARFFLWWEGKHGRPWDPELARPDELDEFLTQAREMGFSTVAMGTAVRNYLRAWHRDDLPPAEAVVVQPDLSRSLPRVLSRQEERALVTHFARRPRGRYWHVYWRSLAAVLLGLRGGFELAEALNFYAGPEQLRRNLVVIKRKDRETERLIHEDLLRVLSAWSARVQALGVGPVLYGRELPRKDGLNKALRAAAKEVLPGWPDLSYSSLRQTFFYELCAVGASRPAIGYFLGTLPEPSDLSGVWEALARLPSLLPEDFDPEEREEHRERPARKRKSATA